MVCVVAAAAYSALVSRNFLQFSGPTNLIWPPYIVTAPSYPDRAVGVVNQPLVNGLIMVAGFITAVFLAQAKAARPSAASYDVITRYSAYPASIYAHPRGMARIRVALVVCAVFAERVRRGFVATSSGTLCLHRLQLGHFHQLRPGGGRGGVLRRSGGPANSIATSVWAIQPEAALRVGYRPVPGGKRAATTSNGPQYTTCRGYAIASHENGLEALDSEIGLIGIVLWMAVLLCLIAGYTGPAAGPPRGSGPSARDCSPSGPRHVDLVSGFTADLRFFDFANLLTFALVGAAVGVAAAKPSGSTPPSTPPVRAPITSGGPR